MRFLAVWLLPAGLGVLAEQDRPQLVWQGEVAGSATLFIKGKRLQMEDRAGSSIPQKHFHFEHALPDARLQVRCEKLQGRGEVRILEQPGLDNNYTLAVRIDDRLEGASPYSLAFFWDSSLDRLEHPREFTGGGRLTWKARVQQEVIVSCHLNVCDAKATSGVPPLHESYRFSRPLPESEVEVNLENIGGRGEVRLLEAPLEKNGYTARVLIRDSEKGAGDYSFTLTWARPAAQAKVQMPAAPGLMWRGRVEGRVRVTVRNGAVISEGLEGQPVRDEAANFYQPLPARTGLNLSIKKLIGAGKVEIVQRPSNQNRYELVFEIDGRQSGSGDYQVEVDW